MSDCLIIMNPRDIPVVKDALADLAIPKLWLTGYTEKQLADHVFDDAINETNFDRYLVMSDDIIVRPGHVEAVLQALDGGCPVATGYSQRSHTDWTVGVTAGPLADRTPTAEAYSFRQYREVVSWPEPLIPTWFAGMSLTGMSRELWQRFPFDCFTAGDQDEGYASDFHLSLRLQDAEIPIRAAREAFSYHWRHVWPQGNLDSPLLIGQVEPAVTLEQPVLTVNDLDKFRAEYAEMSFAEHRAFYAKIAAESPHQNYFSVPLAKRFIEWARPETVVELGGWDGRLAQQLLNHDRRIVSWVNHEIADIPQACTDPDYMLADDQDWCWTQPLAADAFVASHSLEHLNADHFAALLDSLQCEFAYVDVPLSDQRVDFPGSTTTHVLPLTLAEFDAAWVEAGWTIAEKHHRARLVPSEVRFLRR